MATDPSVRSIQSVRAALAPWLALAVVVAAGYCLHETRGAFAPWALVSIVSATFAWAAIALFAGPTAPPRRSWWAALHVAFIVELAIIVDAPLIAYVRDIERFGMLSRALHLALTIALVVFVVFVASRGAWSVRARGFLLFAAFFLWARAAVIPISPRPGIDVFTSGTLGVRYLFQGVNTYAQTYPDIYRGAYGYTPVFFYGPAYLMSAALGYMLGDIRFASVIAEAIFVAVALRYLRGREREAEGKAVLLVWLAFPVFLFMIEQAWIDPLALTAVAAVFFLCADARFAGAGLVAGLALGIKQTSLIAVLLTFAFVVRTGGARAAARYTLATATTAALAYVPYLVWDAEAIWRSLVTTVLETPPRMDALTLRAGLHHLGSDGHDGLLRACGAATCIALFLLLVRRARTLTDLTSATALAYAVVFLCGYQAFCNYYWFVAGLVAVDLLVRTGGARRAAPVSGTRLAALLRGGTSCSSQSRPVLGASSRSRP